MTDEERLIKLLADRSTKRGQFTLASGKQSKYYIDARLTTMSPDGLSLIGKLGLSKLRQSGWTVDSIGGLTLGADPISYAISYTSAGSSQSLRAFTVRKEAKTHGTGKMIEGPFRTSDRVAVIEQSFSALNLNYALHRSWTRRLIDRQSPARRHLRCGKWATNRRNASAHSSIALPCHWPARVERLS